MTHRILFLVRLIVPLFNKLYNWWIWKAITNGPWPVLSCYFKYLVLTLTSRSRGMPLTRLQAVSETVLGSNVPHDNELHTKEGTWVTELWKEFSKYGNVRTPFIFIKMYCAPDLSATLPWAKDKIVNKTKMFTYKNLIIIWDWKLRPCFFCIWKYTLCDFPTVMTEPRSLIGNGILIHLTTLIIFHDRKPLFVAVKRKFDILTYLRPNTLAAWKDY